MQPIQTVPWSQYLENWQVTNPELREPGQPYTSNDPVNRYFLGHEMSSIVRTNTSQAYRQHEFAVKRLWRQWIHHYRENAFLEMNRHFGEIRREFKH